MGLIVLSFSSESELVALVRMLTENYRSLRRFALAGPQGSFDAVDIVFWQMPDVIAEFVGALKGEPPERLEGVFIGFDPCVPGLVEEAKRVHVPAVSAAVLAGRFPTAANMHGWYVAINRGDACLLS